MVKSIETIWKEGFLNSEPISTPQINELYNKKSIHAIDRYVGRFKINIQLIFITSFAILGISFLIGIPIMGIPMFLTFNLMVIVDKILLKKQKRLVKGVNCYEHLTSFLEWMNLKNKWNINMARIMYPVMLISIFLGQWFQTIDGITVGNRLTQRLLQVYPEMNFVFGIPLLGLVALLIIATILVFFAEKLYRWDLNIGYGTLLRKLEEIKNDMEELRK
ncbi:hypothetical protein KO566_14015 [Flavobacteriaceae bacterium XHP0103]|uniref:hypothetical protein n=1 Tax=Marixanthotalea marina TaxID=2844359 RepID=UPI00298A0599|nr:hypothetical protein [Marixanthotalea marina]MBU3823170.1 hypothetical protein [Marixanthotalea marina]